MQFEVSYASYGIIKDSDKQGFHIYYVSGFINEFEISDKYRLFQTPSEIVLLENESVYSIFLLKMDKYELIFLNHQWYTGRSKGNRNCYDGFSMALKYKDILPDIIALSHTFFYQISLYKNTNNIQAIGLQKFISFDKSNTRNEYLTSRNKRIVIELHCSYINIEEVIFNVLNSILFMRNKSKRYVYFTQNKTLFDRISSTSIDKRDFCENKDNHQKTLSNKKEQAEYNLYPFVNHELKQNIEELQKIKAQIELENNFLIELKSNIELKKIEFKQEVQKKKEEISYLENRIVKLRKMIFLLIRLNKKTPLFLGTLLMIISGIITLAITLYIVYGG